MIDVFCCVWPGTFRAAVIRKRKRKHGFEFEAPGEEISGMSFCDDFSTNLGFVPTQRRIRYEKQNMRGYTRLSTPDLCRCSFIYKLGPKTIQFSFSGHLFLEEELINAQ